MLNLQPKTHAKFSRYKVLKYFRKKSKEKSKEKSKKENKKEAEKAKEKIEAKKGEEEEGTWKFGTFALQLTIPASIL